MRNAWHMTTICSPHVEYLSPSFIGAKAGISLYSVMELMQLMSKSVNRHATQQLSNT